VKARIRSAAATRQEIRLSAADGMVLATLPIAGAGELKANGSKVVGQV
jgi:hypothetical protein